ncbi:MAG: hypothetical protein WD048_08645 [Chitinophagales bacterium]
MNSKLNELEKLVRKGLENSYMKLLKFKKQKNTPLIISKNGKVVEVKVNTSSNKVN